MKNVEIGIISVILALHFASIGAQYYGTFGRSAYLRPISFPPIQQQYVQSVQFQPTQHAVPFFNRINPDNPQIALAQQQAPQIVRANGTQLVDSRISHGAEMFSFEMFRAIVHAVRNYDANFVISPFSIWSLMLLVAEGAADQSYTQLEKVLRLPKDLNYLRNAYKNFQRLLLVNTTTVELAVNQALFSDINRPVDNGYARILEQEYEADHLPVNYRAPAEAVKSINDHINFRTQGKIQNIVKPDDLSDTQLLLTSAIFFKGQWKFPFNISQTREQAFYRENGEYVAHVPMMYLRNVLPFAIIPALGGSVLELPYGKEDRICMLLILPRLNSTSADVLQNLRNFDIAKINHELHKYDNTDDYDETEVELTMPRFKIDSDLELSTVLEHLGITEIFDPVKANLSKLSQTPTFVSRVFHKAIIEVNEEGTVASGVSGAAVSFKQTPVEFIFNRPFSFLITDRVTNTLLFAGQIRHPLV